MRVKGTFAVPFLMIVVLALLAISAAIDPTAIGADVNPYLSVIIIELLVYALPSVFFCRLRGKEYAARLRIRLFRLNHLIFIFLALLVLVAGCALINLAMYSMFPDTLREAGYTSAGGGINLYMILAYCILPAVTEEFLFRGIALAEYESVSVLLAVLISSLYFSMMHLSFVQFPTYFFSGMVLVLVLYATRSILAPMLVHCLNNIAALWTERLVQRAAGESGEQSILFVFILMCVLFVALILLFGEAQRIYLNYGVTAMPSPYVHRHKKGKSSGALEALVTPPFIVFVVMYAVFTLITT